MKNDAFIIGFNAGRSEYERMNGLICNGIPQRIVTDMILEDFLIAGLLGLPIDDEGYAHQVAMIEEWYQSGIEKYEPNHSNTFELLVESKVKNHCDFTIQKMILYKMPQIPFFWRQSIFETRILLFKF
jgi:hypothetical protein